MIEHTDLTALDLDQWSVIYSPYIGKGYPVLIHATQTIVARDAEDVLMVRFCVKMIPVLEELDREVASRWREVLQNISALREPSPEWLHVIQTWRRAIGETTEQAALPTFAEVERMFAWLDAHRFDGWPDYGAMLIEEVTAWWNLPWWKRAWKRWWKRQRGAW